MRVKIGPYKNWYGPFQIAEAICFWVKPVKDEYGYESKPDWVHSFGEILAYGSVSKEPEVGEIYSLTRNREETWFYKFLSWVHNKKERTIKVHIDDYDVWSMDNTLAYIILPMLKKVVENKNGSPYVDDEDVPENLRSTSAPELTKEQKDNGYLDENHHARWDWVLQEMIFAFECKVDDSWEDEFVTGDWDWVLQKQEDGTSVLLKNEGHTSSYDFEGRKKVQERISNGFRLFGRYYECLWT